MGRADVFRLFDKLNCQEVSLRGSRCMTSRCRVIDQLADELFAGGDL
jgi:hypothetical protein